MQRHLLKITILLLAIAEVALAQSNEPAGAETSPFYIRSWGIGQGLPSSAVSAVTRTRDGYLWLGTDAGLARFDGVNCRFYGLREGLKNLQVSALLEDTTGALWIGTAGGGLGRMVAGRIETYTIKDGLAGDSISSLLEATNGDVWIGTHTGLSIWRNGRFVSPDKKLGTSFIFDLARDSTGNIWVATLYDGLQLFHDGIFSQIERDSGGTTAINARCLLVDREDRVWAGLRELRMLCYDHGKFIDYGTNEGIPEVILNRLAQTSDGRIWAGSSDSGLYYLQDGQFRPIPKTDYPSKEAILAFYSDNDGWLWIGAESSGLGRLGPKRLSVCRLPKSVPAGTLRSLAQTTNGDLWAGVFGDGIYGWQSTQLTKFKLEPANAYPSHLLVETLLAGDDGSLWIGAAAHLFQVKDGRIAYRANGKPYAGDRIWSLCSALGGGIWAGTYNGQVRLEKDGNSSAVPGLDGRPITALVQQSDGTLWIGSLGDGLIRLKDGKLTFLTNKDYLGGNLVRCLLLDRDDTLWIGTDGGGLLRYKGGQFDSLTTKQGLIDDTVLQILGDDNGSLWLGCKRGICRVSKKVISAALTGQSSHLNVLSFSTTDGMLTEECIGNSGAALKTLDGKVCFSTKSGIVVIDPQKQNTHIGLSAVIVEGIIMDGQPISVPSARPAGGIPSLEVPPGAHNLEFQFTGFNFGDPERIQFRYRLEGWDRDWIEARKDRIAHYDKVAPGTYRFRVIGSYNNGPANELSAEIILNMPPLWWQTNWFRSSAILFALTGLTLGALRLQRRRYRARLRRLEQEKAMERERMRISRDLHDELGSDLTYMSMLSDLGHSDASESDRKEKLESMAQNISALSLQMVHSLDEIVWAVNPHNDTLRSLVLYLTQWSRGLFEKSSVRCRYQIQDNLPDLQLPPETRHHLFLAVRESLNNVLKHARASEVCLRVNATGGRIEIEIQDDGAGFNVAATQSGTSRNGLRNIRQRIENLGGQVTIESMEGGGTIVKFSINYSPQSRIEKK